MLPNGGSSLALTLRARHVKQPLLVPFRFVFKCLRQGFGPNVDSVASAGADGLTRRDISAEADCGDAGGARVGGEPLDTSADCGGWSESTLSICLCCSVADATTLVPLLLFRLYNRLPIS